MTVEGSKAERFLFSNTLVGVAKGLEGEYTTIDLRNESSLTGKIKHVDGYMNIELEDAVFYDPRGSEHAFESFFVTARLIRYLHIPSKLDSVEILTNMLAKLRTSRRVKEQSSFKKRRALRYHKEIVAGIASTMAESASKEEEGNSSSS